MTRASQSVPRLDRSAPNRPAAACSEGSGAYGKPFWMAYLANTLVMVTLALLFRYADFVELLGGKELHLGWIVGIGMVGSLAMRLVLGMGIDHYGPRLVWLGSVLLLAAACFGHLAVTSCTGPAIYTLRIVFCCSVAGIFGASITFVSGRAPASRTAELIGVLGTAGFLGMVLGTQLGDLLLGTETITPRQVSRMFITAGSVASISAVFVWLATRGHRRPAPSARPPLLEVLRRYHPGTVFLVGVVMGIALGLPTVFLRTYTEALDIPRIGLFFGAYAVTAIVARILTRRLPERFGTKPMILVGLATLAVSQLLCLLVRSEWQLIIPGIGYGLSHAVLFPSVIAAGTRRFPDRHRGLGTTVILSTWDIGQLVGAPMAGAILHYGALAGLPAYPILFLSIAAMLTAVGTVYLVAGRKDGKRDPSVAELQDVAREFSQPAIPGGNDDTGHATERTETSPTAAGQS